MNVMEALAGRTSVRHYKSQPVEAEKREQVANAFRLAPSARNLQNWKLLWVESPERKAKLRQASAGKSAMLEEAPAVLVAVGYSQDVMTNSHRVDTTDISIAMSYAILEAYELGLGTCWMASYSEEEVKKALGLPEGITVVAISPIGYPAEEKTVRPRKPLKEVFQVL